MLYQQGDVLIELIESIPKDVKKESPKKRGIVLAEGEVTGHAHVITETKKAQLLTNRYNKMFLEVFSDVELKHEEHKKVKIPVGKYIVRKVREYDPFEDEIREVKD